MIRVHGRELAYVLRRSARRSFALQVDARGVRVAAPLPARLDEVERFIAGHAGWLLDKLSQQAARAARQVFEAVDGAAFPLLGASCRLRVGGRGRTVRWRLAADGVEELLVGEAAEPRAALVRGLKQRALAWFGGRVAEYCHRLGLPRPSVRLSSARTRWGSCSAASGIRLHWRLIHLPPALIDYVVAHEVAHLVHMDHSPRFWAVVEQLYPQWKSARAALRAAAAELPRIEPAAASPGG